MFSFVLSLLVLTAMFTLISGAAFLLRKTLLAGHEDDLYFKMRAWAAAGSDARMNGC